MSTNAPDRTRLAASVVIEENDEWPVGRRHLSNHSLEAVPDQEVDREKDREEVGELHRS